MCFSFPTADSQQLRKRPGDRKTLADNSLLADKPIHNGEFGSRGKK